MNDGMEEDGASVSEFVSSSVDNDVVHLQNRWIDTSLADSWTAAIAQELVEGLRKSPNEAGWLVQAALLTRCKDVQAQLVLLQAGIDATELLPNIPALRQAVVSGDIDHVRRLLGSEEGNEAIGIEGDVNTPSRKAVEDRRRLFELQDLAKTWQELYFNEQPHHHHTEVSPSTASKPVNEDGDGAEESWAFDDDVESNASSVAVDGALHRGGSSFPPLPAFLSLPVIELAEKYAASGDVEHLGLLFRRHSRTLARHRLSILNCIPLFSDVTTYMDILPQIDHAAGTERVLHTAPWRNEPDWSEDTTVQTMIQPSSSEARPASVHDITSWYIARVQAIEAETGQVDNALSLVQYGASQGIPELDALGEELSLLSKLVYDSSMSLIEDGIDAPGSLAIDTEEDDWTLARWRASSPGDIVQAFLAHATPATIVDDIRRLALPYLYVLESQLERANKADNDLHDRLLYEWILNVSNTPRGLSLLECILQESKPTMPPGQRLIKSDLTLARLALASLYAYPGTNDWDAMTRIFETLPTLDSGSNDSDSPTHTLYSSITTSTAKQRLAASSPSAMQLYSSLLPYTQADLTAAIDAFDLHLEAAEIFTRWSASQPLLFFLRLGHDFKMQQSWADRLAKTSAAAASAASSSSAARRGDRLGRDFEDEDEWISLLDDLCRLAANKPSYNDNEPRPAFASIDKHAMTRIFFSGLLSSGKFQLARSLFNPSTGERPLEPAAEQEIVLAASREFYDNADSANLHHGNMKLAFECLAVAPSTPETRKERDFIEATSRLSTFRILNAAGERLTPIEIRLTPDKLSLISRLLSSNEDAYRHPEVILDLVAKLGYRGDGLAEARVLSMIADAALAAKDSARAADVCSRMIKAVEQIRRGRDKDKAGLAADLAWKTCYQFGRDQGITDVEQKKKVLGQALLFCPPASMPEILQVWQALDASPLTAKSPARTASKASPRRSRHGLGIPEIGQSSRTMSPARLDLSHSAETAARAARSVREAASAYLPFRAGTPKHQNLNTPPSQHTALFDRLADDRRSPAQDQAEAVKHAISNRFHSGMSWLIGADEPPA